MTTDINFEKIKKQIDDWFTERDNDPHHHAVMAEVAEYNKEIKRITSIVEGNYDRHCGLIADALDYYLRDAYRLEDLKKWK